MSGTVSVSAGGITMRPTIGAPQCCLQRSGGISQVPVPSHAPIGHDGGKPVFVGHYWLTGTPERLSNKVACVDYSVAKGGKLVAYRWDGELELDNSKLEWVRL